MFCLPNGCKERIIRKGTVPSTLFERYIVDFLPLLLLPSVEWGIVAQRRPPSERKSYMGDGVAGEEGEANREVEGEGRDEKEKEPHLANGSPRYDWLCQAGSDI